MPRRLWPALIRAALVFLILPVVSPAAWAGPKYEVLHAFGSGNDGAGLWGSLALDKKGNVYGTTSGGGTHGHGIVFELVRGSGNTWSEAVLHNFPSFPNDGEGPTSGLALDATGDLYGTTRRATGGPINGARSSSCRQGPTGGRKPSFTASSSTAVAAAPTPA